MNRHDHQLTIPSPADFEETFAPEIEAFTPPQTNRETMLPSPTVATPVSPNFTKHQHQYSTSSANGAAEVSTVKPVSLRQGRGARLSFLGGRKKDSTQPPSSSNGSEPMMSPVGSGESNNKGGHEFGHRLSFFRSSPSFENHHHQQAPQVGVPSSVSNGTQSNSNGPLSKSGTEGSDWVTDSGGGSHASYDTHIMSNTPSNDSDLIAKEREAAGGAGTPRLGGMKKRLSILKLGKRTGRSNTMGAVTEE